MVVNVGVGPKVIPLQFGTFFGACFKCNKLGHFAKDCRVVLARSASKGKGDLSPSQSAHQANMLVSCVGELPVIVCSPTTSLVGQGSLVGRLAKVGTCPPQAHQDEENKNSQCHTKTGSQNEENMASLLVDGASLLEEETSCKEL